MARKKQNTNTELDNGYENFLKDMSLAGFRLISISSRFDSKADMKIRLSKKRLPVRTIVTAHYELEKITDDFFDSTAKFKLTVESANNKKLTPITIECSFLGHFHFEKPIKKELAERFTDNDFRLVVWPYLRQLVQDLTGKMGVQPLLIPLSVQEPK